MTTRPTPPPIPVQRSMSRRLWAADLLRRMAEHRQAQEAQRPTDPSNTPKPVG
ncbi:hypothetical protein [Deinococcus yunweiensis]|uniref:hypothetical protein n=1 Tax=Deinococcus yunweiensis TaxID=367282 RepID=UPI00398ED680